MTHWLIETDAGPLVVTFRHRPALVRDLGTARAWAGEEAGGEERLPLLRAERCELEGERVRHTRVLVDPRAARSARSLGQGQSLRAVLAELELGAPAADHAGQMDEGQPVVPPPVRPGAPVVAGALDAEAARALGAHGFQAVRTRIRYQDRAGEVTEREVLPVAIRAGAGGEPALQAWCYLREELRRFAIARIQERQVLTGEAR